MRHLFLLAVKVAACDPTVTTPGVAEDGPNQPSSPGDESPASDDPSVDSEAGDDGSAGDGSGGSASPCCRPDAFSFVYAGVFRPLDASDTSLGNTLEPVGLVPVGNERFVFDTCGTYTASTDTAPHRFNAAGCCPTGFSVHTVTSPGTNLGPQTYSILNVTCIRAGESCPAGCPAYQEALSPPGWRWEATGATTYEWRQVASCVSVVLDDDGRIVEADASGCCPGGRVAAASGATPSGLTVTCFD